MDYRTGKCSQCGAEYKIPASFAHNVARCKLCQGVVHLGAQKERAAGAARISPAQDAPRTPAPAPSAPRPSGSTPPAAPPPPPAAPPAARPTPPRSEPARTHAPSERASVPSAATPASRSGRRVAAVLGLVVALAAALGAYWLLRDGDRAGAHADTPGAPTETKEPPRSSSTDPAANEAHRERGADGAAAPAAEAGSTTAILDLARVSDFDPTSDTTPAEWTSAKESAARWFADPANVAARGELVRAGRKAVPAILNAYKRVDFASEGGRADAARYQALLSEIGHGAAPGGAPVAGDPDAPRRVAAAWITAWTDAQDDVESWITLAKLDDVDPTEAGRLRATFGGQEPPAANGDE